MGNFHRNTIEIDKNEIKLAQQNAPAYTKYLSSKFCTSCNKFCSLAAPLCAECRPELEHAKVKYRKISSC